MSIRRRIVLNTLITYLRSLIAALAGIFTTRWVLNSLGAEDYGLYGLVGSILIFITFLNNVLAGSVSRFFAFEIGKKQEGELLKWFNAAVRVHLVLPIALMIFGLIVGTIAIRYWFNINANDINIACIVFYISLISACVSMILAPYKGMLLANQDISQQSLIEIGQTIVHIILMYILMYIPKHQLIIYASFMAIETIVFQLLIAWRARTLYLDARIKSYTFNELKEYIKNVLMFSVWKSLLGFGNMIFTQGQSVILNLFFGTKLNASYSLATNVSSQSNTLSNSLMMAIAPEIISRKGAGCHQAMLSLSLKTCKYSTFLVALLAVPLYLDIDNILDLWLETPPPYTSVLCQYILISILIDKLTIGVDSVINACGDIKRYQIYTGLAYIMGVGGTLLLLYLFRNPTMLGISILLTYLLIGSIRVYFGRRLAGLNIREWTTTVLFPMLLIISGVMLLTILLINFITVSSFLRFVLVGASTSILFLIFGWYFVFDKMFKDKIISKLNNLL